MKFNRELKKALKQAEKTFKDNGLGNYYVIFPLSLYKSKKEDFWAKYKQEHPDTDYYFLVSLGKNEVTYKLSEKGELELL
jgi:hypothetical protein